MLTEELGRFEGRIDFDSWSAELRNAFTKLIWRMSRFGPSIGIFLVAYSAAQAGNLTNLLHLLDRGENFETVR